MEVGLFLYAYFLSDYCTYHLSTLRQNAPAYIVNPHERNIGSNVLLRKMGLFLIKLGEAK